MNRKVTLIRFSTYYADLPNSTRDHLAGVKADMDYWSCNDLTMYMDISSKQSGSLCRRRRKPYSQPSRFGAPSGRKILVEKTLLIPSRKMVSGINGAMRLYSRDLHSLSVIFIALF